MKTTKRRMEFFSFYNHTGIAAHLTKMAKDEWPVGNRRVYVEQDAAPWKANEVYRIYSEEGWWENLYLLCYDDILVEIRFDWEPTPEDMTKVASKLNP